jgi:pSer/pThr/pTyr-binding forkhead associated (FHA) protein
MQCLIVQSPDGEHRVFDLYGEDVSMGRDHGAELQLNHPSVSRLHAEITWSSGAYSVADADSHNGVYVNRKRVSTPQELSNGDLMRLGRFELIYISGEIPRRFHKLNIPTLQRWYTIQTVTSSDSTHQLSEGMMKRLLDARRFLEGGTLVSETDSESKEWELGETTWTIGRGDEIPVNGWFVGSAVASLLWNGRNHVLQRTGGMRAMKVNGKGLQVCTLEPGDIIDIGNSRHRYEVRS